MPVRPKSIANLAVSLHLTPAPGSLAQTRTLLQHLSRFGEITAFKVLRNPADLSTFTRRAEVLFASEHSASALRGVVLETPDLKAVPLPALQTWNHEEYMTRAKRIYSTEEGGARRGWVVRGSGLANGAAGGGASDRRIRIHM